MAKGPVPFEVGDSLPVHYCASSVGRRLWSGNPHSSRQPPIALYEEWREATENHDAAAVYSLLSSNITDQCTAEQMEQFFEMDEDALTYPQMGVTEVFVAAGNSTEAFMKMELLGEPRAGQRGFLDTYLAALPYPIVKEDGRWHMLLQFPVIGEGCPFEGSYSREEAVPGGTATPVRQKRLLQQRQSRDTAHDHGERNHLQDQCVPFQWLVQQLYLLYAEEAAHQEHEEWASRC